VVVDVMKGAVVMLRAVHTAVAVAVATEHVSVHVTAVPSRASYT
jgi:hypothetical protein